MGDGIDEYVGREAEWAALCATDCVRDGDMPLSKAKADDLVANVWEFVEINCEEEGIQIPDRAIVISLVQEILEELAQESMDNAQDD